MMTHEEWKAEQVNDGVCSCQNCWARYAEYYGGHTSLVAPRKLPPPFVLFGKTYDGFESMSDVFRDLHEAFDQRFNPTAARVPGEFQGKMRLTLTYFPSEDDPVKTDPA